MIQFVLRLFPKNSGLGGKLTVFPPIFKFYICESLIVSDLEIAIASLCELVLVHEQARKAQRI